MFTKLFSSITTSSIWNEDNNTRILWITMLAMSNKEGYVSASVGGLAHEARITKEECEKALKILSSPDEDSRSKEFEGRRIEIIDGGFQLLNHAKYRAMRSEEERREYMKSYMVEYRRTKNVNKDVNNVNECKHLLTAVNHSKPPLAQADADKIQKQKKEYSSGFEEFWKLYPRKIAKGNAYREWKKINPDGDLQQRIMEALSVQMLTWNDLQYVKHPERWIRGECWLNEVKPLIKQSNFNNI